MTNEFRGKVLRYAEGHKPFTSAEVSKDLGYEIVVPYVHLKKMWRDGLLAMYVHEFTTEYASVPYPLLRCPVCGGLPRITYGHGWAMAECPKHIKADTKVQGSLQHVWNGEVFNWQTSWINDAGQMGSHIPY